jgi:hypothetical protein
MIIEEKDFKYMSSAAGEEDLCGFIIETLGDACEMANKNYNADPGKMSDKAKQAFYWRAKMLEHAMLYVEDWKNSI